MRLRLLASVPLAIAFAAGCLPEEEAERGATLQDTAPIETVQPAITPPISEHVASCVAQAEFGAFVGDPEWTEQWNAAGASPVGMQAACEQIDAATLAAVHTEWVAFEAYVEANEEEPPPPADEVAVETTPEPACDPNYTGCVPIALDVDCIGGDGDGPEYTGVVEVIGIDHYGLDADKNGIACD